MDPNTGTDDFNEMPFGSTETPQNGHWKHELSISKILSITYIFISALYGLYLACLSAMWRTVLFTFLGYIITGLGVTAGAHRLWSHRAYKATTPLQIFLMLCHSHSLQETVINWAREHRLHHKYTDTDADPHNSTRGLFYSHIGWVMVKKHPEFTEKAKVLDVTDLSNNAVLAFQQRHKSWLLPTLGIILPTLIPMYFWLESLSNAFHLNMLRCGLFLNITFLFNSAAHKWGYKPYDKAVTAAQSNTLSIFSLGEGYHNYHHIFPWDYKSTELNSPLFCFTPWFIDICAYLGLAYDLREASAAMVNARADRTGDGTDLWGNKKK